MNELIAWIAKARLILTENEAKAHNNVFPGKFRPPPVSVAHWTALSWLNYYLSEVSYKEWVCVNGWWKNPRTKEESLFHPKAVEIGSAQYSKARKWCRDAADAHNKRLN